MLLFAKKKMKEYPVLSEKKGWLGTWNFWFYRQNGDIFAAREPLQMVVLVDLLNLKPLEIIIYGLVDRRGTIGTLFAIFCESN